MTLYEIRNRQHIFLFAWLIQFNYTHFASGFPSLFQVAGEAMLLDIAPNSFYINEFCEIFAGRGHGLYQRQFSLVRKLPPDGQ